MVPVRLLKMQILLVPPLLTLGLPVLEHVVPLLVPEPLALWPGLVVPVREVVGLMDAEARLALQRALSGVLQPSPRRPHLLATTQTQASLTHPREASSAEVLMAEDLRGESSVVLCQ